MKHIYKMLLLLAAVLITSSFVSCEKEKVVPDEPVDTSIIYIGSGQISADKEDKQYLFIISAVADCKKEYDDWGLALARKGTDTEIISTQTMGEPNVTGTHDFRFELTIPEESMNITDTIHTPIPEYEIFPCMKEDGKMVYDRSGAQILKLKYKVNVQPSPIITEAKQTGACKESDSYIFDVAVTAKCNYTFEDWGVSICYKLNTATYYIMSSQAVEGSNKTDVHNFKFEYAIPAKDMNTTTSPYRPSATYFIIPYVIENGTKRYNNEYAFPLTLEMKASPVITEAKQTDSRKERDSYIFDISVTAQCNSHPDDWGVSIYRTLNDSAEIVSTHANTTTGSRIFSFDLTIPEGEMNTTSDIHTPKYAYSVVPYMLDGGKATYDMENPIPIDLKLEVLPPVITEAKQTDSRKERDSYIFDISVTAKCNYTFDDWGVSLNRTIYGNTEEISLKTVGTGNVSGSRTFIFELTIPVDEMNTTSDIHTPKYAYSVVPYMLDGDKVSYNSDGKVSITLEYGPTKGKINGHDWVDLGLPSGLKWATCNVGASSPEEYGNYYAWGETSPKAEYTSGNCSTWDVALGDISGNATYDAARANWGSTWRMPTQAEMEELKNNCTWEWTSQGGHYGYKVSGKNGNSIFLPAAGYRYGSSLYSVGEYGRYWSSTPHESNTDNAYFLGFNSGNYDLSGYYNRDLGQSVRPVSD